MEPQFCPLDMTVSPRHSKLRRKRRDLVWWQICWLAGVMLVVLGISSLVEKEAGYYVTTYTLEMHDKRLGRRLMEQISDNTTEAKATSSQYKNCTEPALHEFPDDVFTNEERQQGAITLHLFCEDEDGSHLACLAI